MTQKAAMRLPSIVLYKCSLCDFASKHLSVYKKHKRRCEKQHDVTHGTKGLNSGLESVDGVTAVDDSTVNRDVTDELQETPYSKGSTGTNVCVRAEDDGNNTIIEDDESNTIPAVASWRGKHLYQCTKCDLATYSTRKFFYHQVRSHDAKFSIYTCKDCEYTTRFKYRLIRHMKSVHDMNSSDLQNVEPEHYGTYKVFKPTSTAEQVYKLERSLTEGCFFPQSKLFSQDPHVENARPSDITTSYPPMSQRHTPLPIYYSGKPPANMTATPLNENSSNYIQVIGYIKPFMCSTCGLKSNWKRNIKEHIRTVHTCFGAQLIELVEEEEPKTRVLEEKQLEPIKVSKPKKDENDVLQIKPKQVEMNDQIVDNKCFIQNKGLETKSSNISVDKHWFKSYKCSECSYRSNYSKDVRRHASRIHSSQHDVSVVMLNPDIAKATLANYRYDRSQALISKAMNTHAEIFKCFFCEYINKNKENLFKHLNKHKMKAYECTACNETSNRKSIIEKHIRSSHPMTDTTICENFYVVKHANDIPGVNDSDKAALKDGISHSLKPSNPVVDKDVVSPPIESSLRVDCCDRPKKEKKIQCSICPYKLYSVSALKVHMPSHTAKPGVKQLKCRYCPYYIGASKNHLMKKHEKLHSEFLIPRYSNSSSFPVKSSKKMSPPQVKRRKLNKKHKCELCPYRSHYRPHLSAHKRCHVMNPDAKYKCDQCDYWVTQQAHLNQHRRLHENIAEKEHFKPSRNLFTMSVQNQHFLPKKRAEVALASIKTNADSETNVSNTHDLTDRYDKDVGRKKRYECNTCRHICTSRANLLAHLRNHMWKKVEQSSEFIDYSADDQHSLNELVKEPGNPYPELSKWNADNDYADGQNKERKEWFENAVPDETDNNTTVCQYCDQVFPGNASLIEHETRHLIGNSCESL